MNLFILRHAIAVERAEWNQSDSERPLTKEGIRKMEKVARGMKRLDLTFDHILTSPYRRAYDTAQIVADVFRARKKIKIVRPLASDSNPERLVKLLALNYLSKANLLLVGHEPYLSNLISVWIGSERPLAMDFKKGGLCKLTADSLRYGPCATLDWWMPPKIMRKIK